MRAITMQLHHLILRAALSSLVCFLAACGSSDRDAATANTSALREALLQADSEFSALAFDQGVEKAYERFIAADAVQLPDGGMPLAGKAAIMENVEASVGGIDFSLSWEPEDAVVAASGDLGYTWGYYYLETMTEDGELYAAEGKYANVWRNTPAGWQVVLDVSNQNEPPFPAELEFDALLNEEATPSP